MLKTDNHFLVIALCKVINHPLHSDWWPLLTLLSCCLFTTHTFQHHLSSVLSKLSHKKYYSGVTSLDGVTWGSPSPCSPSPPLSDATVLT